MDWYKYLSVLRWLFLAVRAIKAGALADQLTLDCTAAMQAGLPISAIDKKLLAEVTGIAVAVSKITQGCAACSDCLCQDMTNFCDQNEAFLFRKP